jgi:isoleucyl-tRNA synthetase
MPQTRGWFYTLMVLATALFDRPPFRTCICHGVILDERGHKLSKRLRNYPDPLEVFETHGADALRWFLVSSPILRGNELRIDREGKGIADVVRNVLNPFWNAYAFFCLYANVDGMRASWRTDAAGVLDRYLLAKSQQLVAEVTARMDDYDLSGACQRIVGFLDVLTNWYVRRSRERFWSSDSDADKRDAYDTLYTALVTLCRTAAPLLPLLSEAVFRGLTAGRSVHLEDWPDAARLPADPELVAEMDRVRDACSAARMLRESHGVRVRQPLRALTVAGPGATRLAPYVDLIRDEVNVKQVRLAESIEEWATIELVVNARVLGPRLGAAMKQILADARAGLWRRHPEGGAEVAGQRLAAGEYSLRLEPRPGIACQTLSTGEAIVVLDLDLDEELVEEGVARDLVRAVQQTRKDAGLHVSDRIRLTLALPDDWRKAAERFRDWIADQTLAREVELVHPDARSGKLSHRAEIGGRQVGIGLERVREDSR